jgi:hypothetical protein
LQDCTVEEQRGVVRLLWAEGVKPVEIHRRMLAQYGHSTICHRKVYEWVERFKSGRTRSRFTSDEEVKEVVQHLASRAADKLLLRRNA